MEANAIIENVTKTSFFSRLPKWLKITLIIISILTLVYWVGFIVIKILSLVRFILQEISKKEHYWFFIVTMLVVGIVALLLSQYVFGLDPFGKIGDWCTETYDKIINEVTKWILSLNK